MLAQTLRQRVTFQAQVENVSASGEPIGFDWVNVLEDEPASVTPLSGRELLAAAAEHAEVNTRAVVRYNPQVEITSAMRMIHEGFAHNIIAVIRDPTFRRHITLMLSEGLRDEPVQTVTIIDGGAPDSEFEDLIDGGSP